MWYGSRRDRIGASDTRVPSILICLICCALAGPAPAQSLTDGPLAAPDAERPAPSKVPKPASTAHAKKSAAKSRTAASPHASRARDAQATDRDEGGPTGQRNAERTLPRPVPDRTTDPLSLGMKWQGSNDSPEQTRTQNYGGTAPGTGASVGLNYHF